MGNSQRSHPIFGQCKSMSLLWFPCEVKIKWEPPALPLPQEAYPAYCRYKVCKNLFTSCRQVVFALLVPSCCLEQAVDNLSQTWWHYQTCCKVVLTSLIQSWYSKNVTNLTTQDCNNIVISWLYRTCYKVVLTSLIQSWYNKRMLQGWRHKIVTILLCHDCIGLVGTTLQTSLLISTRLLQLLTSCSILVNNCSCSNEPTMLYPLSGA
jgi:hypothetical protein